MTEGPKALDGVGNLVTGELETRRYAWNLNGLDASECLVVGGEEVASTFYSYDPYGRISV